MSKHSEHHYLAEFETHQGATGNAFGTGYLSLVLVILAIFVGLVRLKSHAAGDERALRELVGSYHVDITVTRDSSWRDALVNLLLAHDLLAEIAVEEPQVPIQATTSLTRYFMEAGIAPQHLEVKGRIGSQERAQVQLWRLVGNSE